MNKNSLALISQSSTTDRADGFSPVLALRSGGAALTLSQSDERRLALLSAVRQGEPVELQVDIRAFQQRKGVSNRNYIRFKNSILTKLAKSFVGLPLLRDHDRSLESRGGTIIASKAVKIEGGVAFDQTIELTAPFAVEAMLSRNLDSFSIGWDYPGLDTLECSACKGPAFGSDSDCPHLPGDKLENGNRAEFIFTEAEGVECSAVTVPAVKGTGLDQIRSALSAGRLLTSKQRDESAEDQEMKNIAKTLGIKEDADESTIVAGIGALTARAESAESALGKERTDHSETKTQLESQSKRIAELDAAGVARDVDALCSEFASHLPRVRDESGELEVQGKLEIEIRKLAASDIAGARAMLEAMPAKVVPVLGGIESSQTEKAESATPIPLSLHGASEVAKAQRALLGISEEDFAKFNSINGSETPHLRGNN